MRKTIGTLMAVMVVALMISCSGGGNDDNAAAEAEGYDATGTWIFNAELQEGSQEPPIELPSNGMQVDIEQNGDKFVVSYSDMDIEGTVSGTEYMFVYTYPDTQIPITVQFTLTSATTATGTAKATVSGTTYTYALTGTKKESGSAVIYAD